MNPLEDMKLKQVHWINIKDIKLPDWDVRWLRDAEWTEFFTEQIKKDEIQTPLHVLKLEDGYLLLEGRTRYLAAQNTGISRVPCLVHEKLDVHPMLYSFKLNMLQNSLGPVSIAKMCYVMRFEWNWTIEEVAEALGFSRQHVYRLLKLIEKPVEELKEIELGLRPAWQKEPEKPRVSHDVTHGGKKGGFGVRCPVCGCFPEKGVGKWIYFCNEHVDAYSATLEWIYSGEWKHVQRGATGSFEEGS